MRSETRQPKGSNPTRPTETAFSSSVRPAKKLLRRLLPIISPVGVVLFVLLPSIPEMYDKIPLSERCMFIPWLILIYTYTVLYYYDKVHHQSYVINGMM